MYIYLYPGAVGNTLAKAFGESLYLNKASKCYRWCSQSLQQSPLSQQSKQLLSLSQLSFQQSSLSQQSRQMLSITWTSVSRGSWDYECFCYKVPEESQTAKSLKHKQFLLIPLEIPPYLHQSANTGEHNSGSCSSSLQVRPACS